MIKEGDQWNFKWEIFFKLEGSASQGRDEIRQEWKIELEVYWSFQNHGVGNVCRLLKMPKKIVLVQVRIHFIKVSWIPIINSEKKIRSDYRL